MSALRLRVIIESRGWEYRLHVREQEPCKYFISLRGLDGAKLKPPTAIGSFRSLDLIRENAHAFYLQLVAMREANKTAVASSSLHETTLNHSSEFSGRTM